MKEFVCDCVNPDFEELGVKDVNEFSEFIDDAEEIGRTRFLKVCSVLKEIKKLMFQFPNSYSYWKNGEIYFFENSRIENFFKEMKGGLN